MLFWRKQKTGDILGRFWGNAQKKEGCLVKYPYSHDVFFKENKKTRDVIGWFWVWKKSKIFFFVFVVDPILMTFVWDKYKKIGKTLDITVWFWTKVAEIAWRCQNTPTLKPCFFKELKKNGRYYIVILGYILKKRVKWGFFIKLPIPPWRLF